MSASPPHAVLARLAARGREWRQSALPPALAETTAHGFLVRIHGDAFRLAVAGWREPLAPRLTVVCAGSVAAAGTGAVLRASVRHAWPTRGFAVAFVLFAAWLAAGASPGSAFLGALAGVAGVGLWLAFHARTSAAQADALEWVLRDAADAPSTALNGRTDG